MYGALKFHKTSHANCYKGKCLRKFKLYVGKLVGNYFHKQMRENIVMNKRKFAVGTL